MKKILSALLIAALALFTTSAFADVGCYNNGSHNASTGTFNASTHCGPTTDINYISPGGSSQQTQVGMVRDLPALDQNLFAAGVAQGDYTSIPSTTTAVPTGYALVRKVATSNGDAAFTAGTLANGYPGQVLTITIVAITPSSATTGGNFTITPATSTAFTSVKLSAVHDTLNLLFLDPTNGWVIIGYSMGGSSSITFTDKA